MKALTVRPGVAGSAELCEVSEPAWLERLITRRVPLDRWQEALESRPGDVKTVIEISA